MSAHRPSMAAQLTPVRVTRRGNAVVLVGGVFDELTVDEWQDYERIFRSLAEGFVPEYVQAERDRRICADLADHALAAAERDAPGALRRVTVEPIQSPAGPVTQTPGPAGPSLSIGAQQ